MDEIRIDAEINVLLKDPDEKVAEIIRRESADAEVVMLGLGHPGKRQGSRGRPAHGGVVRGTAQRVLREERQPVRGDLVTPEVEEDPEAEEESEGGKKDE